VRRWRAVLALLPAVAYAAAIYWLSSRPNPFPFLPALLWDKLLHALEYAVLAALLVPALRSLGLAPPRAFWVALAAASAYGASDEIHQAFVPGRLADVLDWLADSAGAAVGAGTASLALRRHGPAASIRP
jgi:VanZ family protein